MKKNICRVLVVALLLTTVFAIANLDSLVDAFDSMTGNSKSNVIDPHSIEGGYLSLEFDKDKAQVGEIVVAKVNLYNVDNVAGFQVNVKYDPEILQPVNPDTGQPMERKTMPKNGDLLVNSEYGAIAIAENKIEEGIINFGKTYTYLEDFRLSGNSEGTGTLAEIGFKVSGTMLYNWEGNRTSDYIISQPCIINGEDSDNTVDPTNPPVGSDSNISLELDKNSASIGDIINATIKVENIHYVSAYQINIKYDPEVLQPINPDTLKEFNSGTMPVDGTIVANSEYGPFSIAANDIEKGVLNFGKSYVYMNDYCMSGKGENSTGTIGTIAFKVLKEQNTSISFAETDTMPNSVLGTLLYDWDGNRITDYLVTQPENIILSKETSEPEEPIKPANGYIEIELDKTSAQVGEIIKAYINVNDITSFSAYQLNIKYDSTMLEAVNVDTGRAFGPRTVPDNGDILVNPEYGSVTVADNNLSNGTLNFGKTYTYMEDYRKSGNPEKTGTIGIIGFKVLREGSTNIKFEETNTMPNSILGTYLYNWYGERLSNYTVVQPKTINSSLNDDDSDDNGSDDEPDISENHVTIVVDKKTASVGEIVTATFMFDNIENFSGYQLNIQYDPNVLEPVQSSGVPYGRRTMPEGSTVINNQEFMPLTVVAHDLEDGKMCFGKVYLDMASLKQSDFNENSGILGEISFKVLSKERTEIAFDKINSISGEILGALMYNSNSERVPEYSVQKSVTIN